MPPRLARTDTLATDDPAVRVRTVSVTDGTDVETPAATVITVDGNPASWGSGTMATLRSVCDRVVATASPGQTLVLGTPIYIGATRDLLMRPLELRGLVAGTDVNVAFWPTPSRPARAGSRPQLVGGATVGSALAAVRALAADGPAEVVFSPEMAEAAALAAFPRSRVGASMKRAMDVAVSAVALALLFPLLLVVALAIRANDRGPVLFIQERVGLNGRPFRMRKFRTMVDGAEARLDEVAELNGIRGPAFQIERDPRLTRIGALLRRTSVDELPQLWNVLRGDMSLVGPRPAPQVEVSAYEPWHSTRLTMRPGITGLAQVQARSYVDFDEKANLDLEYIVRWSPMLDLRIMVWTIPVVLRLSGR